MYQRLWTYTIVLLMVLGVGVTVGQQPAAAATSSRVPLAQTITGSITTSDPTQQGYMDRTGTASACDAPKAPPVVSSSRLLHFDAYSFTNTASAAMCYTVTLTTSCVGSNLIFSAAYLGQFNPANVQQQYLADAGMTTNTGQPLAYSFTVAAEATFIVVVHEAFSDSGCAAYTLDVTTPTATATATATATLLPTATATATATATVTLSPSPTETPMVLATATATNVPLGTAVPTVTRTTTSTAPSTLRSYLPLVLK